MNPPLVSIVIPLYNSENFIRETISSVLQQTYANWELMVVDDVSSDGGPEIVAEFSKIDSRIQLFKASKNYGGPAGPRNLGIRKAKGEFVAFLDSDDLWLPQKLALQVKFMLENPDIDVVGTNAVIIPQGSSNALLMFKNKRLTYSDLLRAPLGLLGKTYIINSSVLMRRSAIEAIGEIDESPSLIASEDYDYWLRVLQCREASIAILRASLVKYRIHPNNLTGLSDRSARSFDRLKLIYQKHHHPIVENLLKRLPALAQVHRLKIQYYSGKINTTQLLWENVSLGAKCAMIFAKLLRRFHG